jgi:hypothetical protein
MAWREVAVVECSGPAAANFASPFQFTRRLGRRHASDRLLFAGEFGQLIIDLMNNRDNELPVNSTCRPPWLARTVIVAAGLGLWFLTQWLIGTRPPMTLGDGETANVSTGDILFHVTRPINEYLHANPRAADALLIASSGVIDALGIWLIAASIFGPTMRPFLGLLILFALRQVSQAICVLPAPDGMIWRYPGVPSLLVTYQVANDFFFSGHTAIAVFGGLQFASLKRPWWMALGFFIAAFEMATVIVLRAHYSIDVFTGAVAALWATSAAAQLAPRLDCWIARSVRATGDE